VLAKDQSRGEIDEDALVLQSTCSSVDRQRRLVKSLSNVSSNHDDVAELSCKGRSGCPVRDGDTRRSTNRSEVVVVCYL
jgi:hypothetical protein